MRETETSREAARSRGKRPPETLGEQDLVVVRALAAGTLSYRQLAETTEFSVATVYKRTKRLVKEGFLGSTDGGLMVTPKGTAALAAAECQVETAQVPATASMSPVAVGGAALAGVMNPFDLDTTLLRLKTRLEAAGFRLPDDEADIEAMLGIARSLKEARQLGAFPVLTALEGLRLLEGLSTLGIDPPAVLELGRALAAAKAAGKPGVQYFLGLCNFGWSTKQEVQGLEYKRDQLADEISSMEQHLVDLRAAMAEAGRQLQDVARRLAQEQRQLQLAQTRTRAAVFLLLRGGFDG